MNQEAEKVFFKQHLVAVAEIVRYFALAQASSHCSSCLTLKQSQTSTYMHAMTASLQLTSVRSLLWLSVANKHSPAVKFKQCFRKGFLLSDRTHSHGQQEEKTVVLIFFQNIGKKLNKWSLNFGITALNEHILALLSDTHHHHTRTHPSLCIFYNFLHFTRRWQTQSSITSRVWMQRGWGSQSRGNLISLFFSAKPAAWC